MQGREKEGKRERRKKRRRREIYMWMPTIGRTDVEAETPILWPPDAKN